MAALTGSELRYARRRVGSLPVTSALQEIYDAYSGDGVVQPLEWTILDVLENRLAELIRNPATFAVAGEYSQSTAANIDALKEQIKGQRTWMEGIGIVLDVSNQVGFGVVHAEGPAFYR